MEFFFRNQGIAELNKGITISSGKTNTNVISDDFVIHWIVKENAHLKIGSDIFIGANTIILKGNNYWARKCRRSR